MKGSRYYKNLDFSKPVGTHRYVDNIKDRRQLAKVCLVAMARINQAEQGTITEPYELASSTMKDGRTLIKLSTRMVMLCIMTDGSLSNAMKTGHFTLM